MYSELNLFLHPLENGRFWYLIDPHQVIIQKADLKFRFRILAPPPLITTQQIPDEFLIKNNENVPEDSEFLIKNNENVPEDSEFLIKNNQNVPTESEFQIKNNQNFSADSEFWLCLDGPQHSRFQQQP